MSLEDARTPCPTLLVEDHPLMRETLSEFLREMSAVELIGMVASAEEALRFCEEQCPSLVLIDVSLPGMNGIDLVATLNAKYPDTRCLMLSGHREISYVERALSNGARGYVLKGDPTELLRGVAEVARGGTYLSELVRARIETDPGDDS